MPRSTSSPATPRCRLARLTLLCAALLTVAACDRSAAPDAATTGPTPPIATPENSTVVPASCAVDVAAVRVTCSSPAAGTQVGMVLPDSSIVFGTAGGFLSVAASNASLTDGLLAVDLAVRTEVGQPIGTRDGATRDARGLRLFVVSTSITAGEGQITFTDQATGEPFNDGMNQFTAPTQPYVRYDTLLATGESSRPRPLRMRVSSGVRTFVVALALNAAVPAPLGWVAVTPDTATLEVGQQLAATGLLRDALGRPDATQRVQWTTSAATVATIDATGRVTAVAPGTARITGMSAGRAGVLSVIVAAPTSPAPAADVTFAVYTASRFDVSRFIYGMNLPADIGADYAAGFPWYGARPPTEITLSRFGGNRLTAYNWENNYSNAGADYRHQNDSFVSPSTRPGEAVRTRVAAARAHGAATIVTVPMIGYVAANGNGVELDTTDANRAARLAANFRVSRAAKGAPFSLTPNTGDGFVYQDEFVHWVDQTFPGAIGDPTAPIFFSLDNEPDSWHATHREILSNIGDDPNRPRLQTYDGFIDTTIAYARAIKGVAPDAKVFGPTVATWVGVVNLGRYPYPDPVYGTELFFDVYLRRMREAEATYGRRLLDVLDLHWYPATGTTGGEITNDYAPQDAAMVTKRLQAPRSLWDPTYDEQSWVSQTAGGPVRLLPRLHDLIDARYPGTKIAITEYYYGRGGDISGGIAQADVLGIFGREGVYAAAFWPQAGIYAAPYQGSGAAAYAYVFGAFRMFLDYDGSGSRFGDTGVRATTSDAVNTSVYASLDDQGRVVLVAINKTGAPVSAGIAVTHPTALHTARAYTLTAASATPTAAPAPTMGAGNTLTYTMPAMSVSTLVLTP